MKIKICANNVTQNRIEEYIIQFGENTTMLDMKEKLNIRNEENFNIAIKVMDQDVIE